MIRKGSLRDELNDWMDWDFAACRLGYCLGLFPEEGYSAAKHVFWTNHPVGEMLDAILDRLVDQGVLEKRDEPDT